MNEIWLPILGYEGLYEISNMELVKVCEKRRGTNYSVIVKERIKKPSRDRHYYHVSLCKKAIKKTFRIHRLVATHFVDNPNSLPEVNHIDGDKLNNKADNLEWVTRLGNERHAYRHGLKRPGSMWGNSKPVLQYSKNGSLIKKWSCLKEIWRTLGHDRRVISRCCDGKTQESHGFVWRYAA